ncbi:MAG: 16S rRNA (adenine(1518)-N(6)/adenine(1519)-N(6))-dimethyltransferase RsmA [Nitrososphaeraceae archaeon]
MRVSKRKYLGQHYLNDSKIVEKIISYSNIKSEEIVCEMGTGNGILTSQLCKHAKFVRSFEIDEKKQKHLINLTKKHDNLEIINKDIIKEDVYFDIFVSNIPYSQTRKIFFWLTTKKFNRAVIMIQKEVSEKIISKKGQKKYRSISAILQYCFYIERLFAVNKRSFDPIPKVDSEIIRLTTKNKIMTKNTISIINWIFSLKNKKVSNILKKYNIESEFGNLKIKELSPEQLVALSKKIKVESKN